MKIFRIFSKILIAVWGEVLFYRKIGHQLHEFVKIHGVDV